ncbi:hypothetical protein PINS_up018760 [Pythium insidiosum]|nr:hypothetical protein PINS_up018760 [Pythium insidiosum]
MAGDRFAALEVQTAIAATLATGLRNGFFAMDTIVLDLAKQFYVTLHDAKARDALATSLKQRLLTKDDVKALVTAGLSRAMLQTALDALRAEAALARWQGDDADVGGDEEEDVSEAPDAASVALLRNAVDVFTRLSRLVCPQPATQRATIHDGRLPALCTSVVSLGLSRVTLVLEDVVRLLQMLVEYAPTESVLIATVPDLRGVLEKLTVLTTTPSTRPTIADAGLAQLCRSLRDRLLPQIDAFERLNGSLVGLPTDDDDDSGSIQVDTTVAAIAERELERAALCKTRGNAFFQRGNVCTARVFYRRAIAMLRQAEAQAEQRLSSLDKADVLAQCSVGTSVLVRQRDGSRRSAMIADVEGNLIEVIYDGDNADEEEEETVPVTRIQLRLPTALLQRFLTAARRLRDEHGEGVYAAERPRERNSMLHSRAREATPPHRCSVPARLSRSWRCTT